MDNACSQSFITVQLLEVTRKSMVGLRENKANEKVLECTNLTLSSG